MDLSKEIVNSSEMKLDIKFEEGKAKLIANYDGKGADAGVYIHLEAGYFLDKLAAAIPGQIDDQVIALLKAAILPKA